METDDEYAIVNGMGLDYIQGFLFGRPVPPEEFEKTFLANGADAAPAAHALQRSKGMWSARRPPWQLTK